MRCSLSRYRARRLFAACLNSLCGCHKRNPDQVKHPINRLQRRVALRSHAFTPPETLLHLEEHIVDLIVGEGAVSHRGGKMRLVRNSVNWRFGILWNRYRRL